MAPSTHPNKLCPLKSLSPRLLVQTKSRLLKAGLKNGTQSKIWKRKTSSHGVAYFAVEYRDQKFQVLLEDDHKLLATEQAIRHSIERRGGTWQGGGAMAGDVIRTLPPSSNAVSFDSIGDLKRSYNDPTHSIHELGNKNSPSSISTEEAKEVGRLHYRLAGYSSDYFKKIDLEAGSQRDLEAVSGYLLIEEAITYAEYKLMKSESPQNSDEAFDYPSYFESKADALRATGDAAHADHYDNILQSIAAIKAASGLLNRQA